MGWLVNVLFVGCTVAAVNGVLVSPPVGTAAFMTLDAMFNCTGSVENETHPYTWQFNAMNQNPVVIAWDCRVTPQYIGFYETEVTDDGGCTLKIIRVQYQSAGTYTCQHSFDQGSAQLVVLNSNSSCSFGPTDLVSGEFISVSCYLNYNGTVAPLMDFRSETGEWYQNATINTYPTQVNGHVSFPVYQPTTRAVTANTWLPLPMVFSFTWTLPMLYVQFETSNQVAEMHSDYECGNYVNYTTLTCTADGFPDPDFTWLDVNTNDIYTTSTVVVTKPGMQDWICTAYNEIRGIIHMEQTELTFNVSGSEPTTCPPEPVTTQEITTEEITTTTVTTTTSEPTTTTTPVPTTTIPFAECGSIMRTAPSDAPITPNWGPMCYINRTDTAYLNTMCRDLIQRLAPDFDNYQDLLTRGGNFGCVLLTRADFVGADYACFDNYQQTSTLNTVPTANKLVVCIRLP